MVLIFNMLKTQETIPLLETNTLFFNVGILATTTALDPKTGAFKDKTEHPTTANHFKGPPPIQPPTAMML